MAEYIEKQEAIKELCETYEHEYPTASGAFDEYATRIVPNVLRNLPPADVRPVVLCDKCRWFDDIGYPNPDPEMPELRIGHCGYLGRDVQACWFCATGERKGGDADG